MRSKRRLEQNAASWRLGAGNQAQVSCGHYHLQVARAAESARDWWPSTNATIPSSCVVLGKAAISPAVMRKLRGRAYISFVCTRELGAAWRRAAKGTVDEPRKPA